MANKSSGVRLEFRKTHMPSWAATRLLPPDRSVRNDTDHMVRVTGLFLGTMGAGIDVVEEAFIVRDRREAVS
jgi:hypothetical protein